MITVTLGEIRFFGVTPYYFFAGLALLIAMIPAVVVMLKKGEDLRWFGWQFLFSLLGLLLGGRFFGFLVEVFNCLYEGRGLTLTDVGHSAFVAYGGIFGFLLVYFLSLRWLEKHRDIFLHKDVQMDVLGVFVPLFHGTARFSCLFAGCCYGVEYDGPLMVHYFLQDGGERFCFPVQILEAGCLFLIFLGMLVLYVRGKHPGELVFRYLGCYAVCRFLIEFLRGDEVRGLYFGVSFSQIVSAVLLLILAIRWFRKKRRAGSPEPESAQTAEKWAENQP